MNPINSIKARIQSYRNNKKSGYWEFVSNYQDGILWEDTIFFESFGGSNFQGNPYYIYRELICNQQYLQYRAIIAHKNPEDLKRELILRGAYDQSRVRIVRTNTSEYREAVTHAKYLVNNVGFSSDFIKKEGQVYLNTWHGTPLKTLGRRVKGDAFACINGQRNFLMCDYLLAPNQLTKTVYEEDHMVKGIMAGECYLGAYPRNSIFFDEKRRTEVRETYGLNKVTSIFYMPTWRGTNCGIKNVDQVSEMERLAKELGEDYRVYVKFHPAMVGTNTKFENCLPMPEGIEVYDFLNATDILITDYSSVFFDFASAKQRMILYQYDAEEYFQDRGVYQEVAENVPFDTVYTYEQLIKLVKSEQKRHYPAFLQRFCKYDNLFGAKQALEKLLQGKQNVGSQTVDLYVINWAISEAELLALKRELADKSYRFVFVLGRGYYTGKVSCWDSIDYSALYTYNRLTPKERRRVFWLKLSYALFRSKKALKRLREYAKRERRRIWGDMQIGHIYAKNKKLPIAVRYDVEKWQSEE